MSATMLSIPQLLCLIKVLPNSSSVKGQSSSSIPMSKLFSGKSSCDTKLRSVPLDRPSKYVAKSSRFRSEPLLQDLPNELLFLLMYFQNSFGLVLLRREILSLSFK